MPFELLAQYLKLPVFALVAARMAGLLMFQPILGALAVPAQLRLLLVLGMAALLTPLVPLPADAPDTLIGLAVAMVSEILLGGLVGLATAVCFLGLQMGGQMVAQESGLAFGEVADPTTDQEQSVIGVFYVQLAAVVYLVLGGHRALVGACMDTFITIPLLSDTQVVDSAAELLCCALTLSGHVAVRVAAPTLLALFLVNVALGFISRTMPQLNVLAIGFSIKALIAYLLIAVALPGASAAFIGSLERVFGWLSEALHLS